jgi:hypothetical protein
VYETLNSAAVKTCDTVKLDDLLHPLETYRERKLENQRKQELETFYTEQFRVMVGNGNHTKAVELLYDEAANIDARVEKTVTPEYLARYCYRRLESEEEDFPAAVKELEDEYGIEEKEESEES